MESLESLLKRRRGELSEKKRRIAKYILENRLEVAFLTAAELAKRTRVSESTVVRFAKDFGFSGYPQFQEKIQDSVKREPTTINRLKEYKRHFEDESNPVAKSMLLDLHNIEKTLNDIDLEQIDEVIDLILDADRIRIVTFDIFAPLGRYLETVLRWVRSEVRAVTSSKMFFYSELARLTEESLVIGLSFPRYSTEIIECMEATQREGITTVVITDSEFSPLAPSADYLLLAKCRILSYVDSLAAPISLIEAIGTALSLRVKEDSTRYLEKLEQLWEEHDIFFERKE